MFVKDSAGTETEIAELPIVLSSGQDVSGILPVANGGTGQITATGTGAIVKQQSPTLVTPNLDTPSAATLTNATGLPIDGGTTGTLPLNRGGTGQTTKTAAFDALSPTTTKGDVIASDGTNNVRLGVGADGLILKADSTTATGLAWGSAAAGTGEVNYIENPDAEANTTGWATYADAAGATPVDGTGGSPTVTWTRQSSVVLRGNQTFKLTKDAANRQGEGVSYDFTIKGQDTSKKLKIQFDFKTDEDAAFASGDLTVYIYDVTNSTLITPVDTSIIRGQNIYQTSFNSTTSTSYRLIFHIATTNASAWDAYIDNVIVGPGMTSQGAAISGWEDFTPDWDNTTDPTFTASQFKKRRVGGSMEIQFYFNLDTPGTSGEGFAFFLPDGLTPDTSASISTIGQFGVGYLWDGTARNSFTMYSSPSNVKRITALDATFADITWNELATGDYCGIHLSIPVLEWAGQGIVPMLSEDNLSEWQSYTPSNTQGFGTITGNTLQYRRVGDSLELRGYFTAGTTTASEAQLELPSGLSIDAGASTTVVGQSYRENATQNIGVVLATNSDTFFNFADYNSGAAGDPLAPRNGSSIFGSSNRISVSAKVAIQEWSGSQNSLVGYSEADPNYKGLVSMNTDATTSVVGEYEEITITPGGDFTGTAKIVRIGNFVCLTGEGSWTHASLSTATSAAGIVPARFRPLSGNGAFNLVVMAGPIQRLNITTAGTIQIVYFDSSFSPVAATNTTTAPNISYVIA